MRLKNCTVCGREFKSYRGIEVCSDACKKERQRMQWTEANDRRKRGISQIPKTKTCPECGGVFETFRKIYCCKECAEKAKNKYMYGYNREYYEENRDELLAKAKERIKK